MKIRIKTNIEISSPYIRKGTYNGEDVYLNGDDIFLNENFEVLFYIADGWEVVDELSEEEKLNQLRQVLLEWNYEDIVDKIIDEYKKKIQYDND